MSIITAPPPHYLIVATAAGGGDRAMPSQRFSSFEHDVIHHLRMKISHYKHRYWIMFWQWSS